MFCVICVVVFALVVVGCYYRCGLVLGCCCLIVDYVGLDICWLVMEALCFGLRFAVDFLGFVGLGVRMLFIVAFIILLLVMLLSVGLRAQVV